MQTTKYNIFYTDDDVDDQDFFKEIVSEINDGYLVFTQSHGNELMSILQNPPPSPHIVFLDLNMPQKNGYQILEEMRSNNELKQIPVIIFSTSNNESSIQKSKELGANLYITKPSSYSEFKKIMRSVLSYNWKDYSPSDFVFTVN